MSALSIGICSGSRGHSLDLYLRVEGLSGDGTLGNADVEIAGEPADLGEHATRDLEQTLQRLKGLLRPFGQLMLLGAAVSMALGGWVMGRMAVLKY